MKKLISLSLVLASAACQSGPGYDYAAFLEHPPRSILVLPPLDETVETDASYGTLAAVTRPLAERGFYVFPVAVVDAMMRDNGLPTPFEMHEVPLAKLREVFDPDAVLYLTVTKWGTGYDVISSTTRVTVVGRLIDAETGQLLWGGTERAQQGSGGGGSLVGTLTSALVNQVATSIHDPSRDLAAQATWKLFHDSNDGLLLGPYHPDQTESLAKLRESRAKQAAK